jgi:hypothetical protein
MYNYDIRIDLDVEVLHKSCGFVPYRFPHHGMDGTE